MASLLNILQLSFTILTSEPKLHENYIQLLNNICVESKDAALAMLSLLRFVRDHNFRVSDISKLSKVGLCQLNLAVV